MKEILLDKSRAVRIFSRIGESGVAKTLTFMQNGSPFDITGKDWKLFVFKRQNSTVKLFTLSEGSGLTVGGVDSNELLIEITAEQANQIADTYFWRLYSADEDHTWLNGPFVFHNGVFDAEEETTEIELVIGEDIIIEVASSSTGVDHWRGDWDTPDEYPSSGGNGPSGAPKAGDRWRNTELSILNVYGLGTTVVEINAVFEALVDSPGQTAANWKVYQ